MKHFHEAYYFVIEIICCSYDYSNHCGAQMYHNRQGHSQDFLFGVGWLSSRGGHFCRRILCNYFLVISYKEAAVCENFKNLGNNLWRTAFMAICSYTDSTYYNITIIIFWSSLFHNHMSHCMVKNF